VDPLAYAFEELEVGALPRVVYRAIVEQAESSLCLWLDKLGARGGHAVFVGVPSRQLTAPLTLPQTFSLCRNRAPGLRFGGVLIPERHQNSGMEDARVWAKMRQGCGFFVSQTVWSASATKRLLRDLRVRADLERTEVPPILLTFSPCGSPQTLQFLEWLGVEVPPATKRELLSTADMLGRSVALATEMFADLHAFAAERGISVGCNVESVSSRAAEVEAATELIRRIDRLAPRAPAQPGRRAR
jgi:hypothetical protein